MFKRLYVSEQRFIDLKESGYTDENAVANVDAKQEGHQTEG